MSSEAERRAAIEAAALQSLSLNEDLLTRTWEGVEELCDDVLKLYDECESAHVMVGSTHMDGVSGSGSNAQHPRRCAAISCPLTLSISYRCANTFKE